jgi:hypothetical protein
VTIDCLSIDKSRVQHIQGPYKTESIIPWKLALTNCQGYTRIQYYIYKTIPKIQYYIYKAISVIAKEMIEKKLWS